MTDFDKIVLSDNDLQYLESARYGAVLRLHPVVAGHLVKLGFLVPYALSKSDDEFVVTEDGKYSLQGTTQGRYLTGGVPPVRFSM